jgi:hypothetical protein
MGGEIAEDERVRFVRVAVPPGDIDAGLARPFDLLGIGE